MVALTVTYSLHYPSINYIGACTYNFGRLYVTEDILTIKDAPFSSSSNFLERWKEALDGLNLAAEEPALDLVQLGDKNLQAASVGLLSYILDPDIEEQVWSNLISQAANLLKPEGFCLLDTAALGKALQSPDFERYGQLWAKRLTAFDKGGFSFYRRYKNYIALQKSRQNLLYFAPWVTYGGSDKGTIDWFRHLDKSRYRLFLINTQPSENAVLHQIEPYAEEIWNLPDIMLGQKMPQFIMDFVASRNIHLIHIMNSRLAFDMLPALKVSFPHLRTVVQLHAEEEDRSGYVRYVSTRYNNLIDSYSVTSHHLKKAMLDYYISPDKMAVIYTGIDPVSEFNPTIVPEVAGFRTQAKLNQPGLHVLFPARLEEQKDPLLMVEVATRLKELGSKTIIHAVGEGSLRFAIEETLAARGLQERVLLHGASREMPLWYKNTDVTLLTSRFEGVPFVMFEAMAMGCPVVVSDVGANRELVTPATGFLITDRQDVEAYAQALLKLERDYKLLKEMGRAARQHVITNFSIEQMANDHQNLYSQLNGAYLAQLAKL